MRPLRWFAIAALSAAVVASGCSSSKSSSSSTSGSGSSSGGGATKYNTTATITYSLDQEPTNYNVLTSDGNEFDMQQIIDQIWPQAFIPQPDATVKMDSNLLTSATETSTNPQTIVYQINPNAVWSNGTPISAADFIYNWQAQSGQAQYTDVGGKAFNVASNTGYNVIKSVTGSPDGKTVTVVFSQPFPDWKALFSPFAPAQLKTLTGGFNTGLNAANVNPTTLISGGPFMLQAYNQGKDFLEVRNPKYWGPAANLASIDFRFITDSTQVEPALANNEIQASYPQPQLDLLNQLKGLTNVKIDEIPGLQYEHLDFNEANPFLADVNLRKAIAMSIDRPGLISRTVGQFATGIKPDNNRLFVPTQPQYVDNSGGAYDTANVSGAKALLTSNGYTYSGTTLMKNGKAVTLKITSTQGNALRNSEEQVITNDLAQIGITVNEVDTTSLGKTLAGGTFDMIVFAWIQTPFPSGNDPLFQTNSSSAGTGASNFNKFSDPAVDNFIKQADNSTDSTAETAAYNQADAQMWKDMNTLPLFQKPTLLVYNNKYLNMANNPTNVGPPFNAQSWGVAASA